MIDSAIGELMTQSTEDKLIIEEYSLFDFCRRAQELIQDGYVFDLSTNEGCPTNYGTHYTAGLYKEQPVEPTQEPTLTRKPGRPPRE